MRVRWISSSCTSRSGNRFARAARPRSAQARSTQVFEQTHVASCVPVSPIACSSSLGTRRSRDERHANRSSPRSCFVQTCARRASIAPESSSNAMHSSERSARACSTPTCAKRRKKNRASAATASTRRTSRSSRRASGLNSRRSHRASIVRSRRARASVARDASVEPRSHDRSTETPSSLRSARTLAITRRRTKRCSLAAPSSSTRVRRSNRSCARPCVAGVAELTAQKSSKTREIRGFVRRESL